jgi:UDP-N-acetylmuramyl tripeptide synthase
MLGNELDQEFIIQPGRALLLLEAENLLAEIPTESSALRRGSHHQELPLVWDTRKIPKSSCPIIFIARTTPRHNTHSEVDALLYKGHFVIAESQELARLSRQSHGENTHWFNEIAHHPNVILCTSSDRARDLLIQNICKVKTGEWTTLAITGTNGKTSTTQMTSTLLEELSHNSVLRLGTLGIQVGAHFWDNPFPTMPDYPGILSALRAAQNDFNCRQLVMEATSIGIEENRLGHWPVQCAAYLNLTQDHLEAAE